MINRDALKVRNADLEKIIEKMDSIQASLNRQIKSFQDENNILTFDLELSKGTGRELMKVIEIDKIEIKSLKKYAKGRWWIGLLEGTAIGAAIIIALKFII